MSPSRSGRILLALTSHGLGHLTRSLAIAREIRRAAPALEWVVASELPAAVIARDLPGRFEHLRVGCEPGTLQQSCFELDVPGTRRAYRAFEKQRASRLESERRFLAQSRCDALIVDVPALPVRAASDLGLPVLGVSNFTWDWILEPLLAAEDAGMLRQLAQDYAAGTRQLVLPFGPETSPFPANEPAPLVSRRARLAPDETRTRLGLPPREEAALVLVCPGGWSPVGWEPIRLQGCQGMRLLTVGDLPIRADVPVHALPNELAEGLCFPDLVCAADAVVAKPGYGIASECALHRTPLVAIERPGFRETPVLVDAFRRLGPCPALSLRDFFAGRWEAALAVALDSRAAWAAVPENGARQVAERILTLLEL